MKSIRLAPGTRPTLSVVLPMYNEAEVIALTLREISALMTALEPSYEIVCVDDGSSDDTVAIVRRKASRDPHVRLVELARNFGKEAAVCAGLAESRGAAVLVMDADLQHPPDVVPTMIKRWREGYYVVEAVKATRGQESRAYKLAARTFYRLMGPAVGRNLQGSADFKLLDRRAVDLLLAMPEKRRFFRGLVAWMGLPTARVAFDVAERAAGTTSWNTLSLVRYAMGNILSFSSVPLRAVAWLGAFITLLAAILGLHTLWNWATGSAVTGFTTVIIVVLAMSGALLCSIGVVAAYLAQVYDELKGRPTWVKRPRRTVPGHQTRRTETRRGPGVAEMPPVAPQHVPAVDVPPMGIVQAAFMQTVPATGPSSDGHN